MRDDERYFLVKYFLFLFFMAVPSLGLIDGRVWYFGDER